MAISEAGIIKRDEIVFRNALTSNIPVLMVLGGGYAEEAATIMGKSIVNLLKHIIGFSK